MRIQGSTACFPGLNYPVALERLRSAAEPLFGSVNMDHVQLCPQTTGRLTADLASELAEHYPLTQFRLHANVPVHPSSRAGRGDASDVPECADHFTAIRAVSSALRANVYSLHAGRRTNCSLEKMRDNVLKLQDFMGMPVAVEGMYPGPKNMWLLSDWDEYNWLIDSGMYYAVDMSHLKIVATRKEEWDGPLARELVACERCLEIHISDNDGYRDSHSVLTEAPHWWPLLTHANPTATIFTEGNHLREQ